MRWRFNEDSEGLCLSTIVLTELLHGAAKSARPRTELQRAPARIAFRDLRNDGDDHAGERSLISR